MQITRLLHLQFIDEPIYVVTTFLGGTPQQGTGPPSHRVWQRDSATSLVLSCLLQCEHCSVNSAALGPFVTQTAHRCSLVCQQHETTESK